MHLRADISYSLAEFIKIGKSWLISSEISILFIVQEERNNIL